MVGRLQMQATTAIAELIAQEPLGPRTSDPAGDQIIEMLAQLLSGAVQSLAIWWQDKREVSRDRMVDVIMDFCWKGLERLRDEERAQAKLRVAQGSRHGSTRRAGGLGRG